MAFAAAAVGEAFTEEELIEEGREAGIVPSAGQIFQTVNPFKLHLEDKQVPGRSGLLLPGHNWIGPGNPVDNAPAVDRDDEIAEQHDREYHAAHSKDDIRASDWKALKEFGSDFIHTGNWHSGLGALGIGAKYLGESLIGVQYPRSFTGNYAKDKAFRSRPCRSSQLG